ncbi:MAG: hypothetical protein OXQ28_02510 [Acidobacteriota bacterium]|nr:hypothetical protein [Acidobacteriota bacterium]
MTRTALVFVAATVTTTASLAEAQTVESFDRLALLVNQRDHITVTDRAGRELQGRLIDLSPASLSLLTDDGVRDLEETEIAVVRRQQPDSLKNGALVGAISGAVVAGVLMSDEGADPGIYALFMSLFGAAGAGIGIGLDAGYVRSQVIYTARRPTARVAVSPLLSRHRRGLALSFGF